MEQVNRFHYVVRGMERVMYRYYNMGISGGFGRPEPIFWGDGVLVYRCGQIFCCPFIEKEMKSLQVLWKFF